MSFFLYHKQRNLSSLWYEILIIYLFKRGREKGGVSERASKKYKNWIEMKTKHTYKNNSHTFRCFVNWVSWLVHCFSIWLVDRDHQRTVLSRKKLLFSKQNQKNKEFFYSFFVISSIHNSFPFSENRLYYTSKIAF